MRLLAIDQAYQGQGQGRILHDLFLERARQQGATKIYINADQEAVGFYQKLDWQAHIWDEDELDGIASGCLQMQFSLDPT